LPTKFRNPRKTNWPIFRKNLHRLTDHNSNAITSIKDIDIECDKLSKAIMQAYEESCPLSNPPPPGKRSAWTTDLSEKKRKARQTFNVAYNAKKIKRPIEEQNKLWDIHYKHKEEYTKALRSSERNEWKNFTVEVEMQWQS